MAAVFGGRGSHRDVRAELAPWRLKRVRKLLAEMAARLKDEKRDEKE